MQQRSLPVELVWELVVCVPAKHIARLHRSGPTHSTTLNFLLAKFFQHYNLVKTKKWVKEFADEAVKMTDKCLEFVNTIEMGRDLGFETPNLNLKKDKLMEANKVAKTLHHSTMIPAFEKREMEAFDTTIAPFVASIYDQLKDATSDVGEEGKSNKIIELVDQARKLCEILEEKDLSPKKEKEKATKRQADSELSPPQAGKKGNNAK